MFKLVVVAFALVSLTNALFPLRRGGFFGPGPVIPNAEWMLPGAGIVNAPNTQDGINKCEVCEEIFLYLGDALANQDVQAYLRAYVKHAIEHLPQQEQEQILNAYNEWDQAIINTFTHPHQWCQQLGACSAVANQTVSILELFAMPKPSSNVFCAPCQADMQKVSQYVKAATQQGNPAFLNAIWPGVCTQIKSASKQAVCNYAVQMYGQQLTNKVVSFLNQPNRVCNTVGVCNANFPTVSALDQCESLAFQIDQIQAVYNIQPDVLRRSASACEMLPPTFSAPCMKHLGTPILQTAQLLETKLEHCQMVKTIVGQHSQLALAALNEAIGAGVQKLQQYQAIGA